ncbi:MAG: YdeI/OmpD-associated family protein [Saprospiraceae bacterium]|nr:YdeI/OmpD-associated family protein [Saprospiraceae bacterium]
MSVNHSSHAQWRFIAMKEIKPSLVKKYILEAFKNAKEGREIKLEKKAALPIPAELLTALKKDMTAKTLFDSLTAGKQREYIEYISEAKGEDTRKLGVVKSMPLILSSKGLIDKYKYRGVAEMRWKE